MATNPGLKPYTVTQHGEYPRIDIKNGQTEHLASSVQLNESILFTETKKKGPHRVIGLATRRKYIYKQSDASIPVLSGRRRSHGLSGRVGDRYSSCMW